MRKWGKRFFSTVGVAMFLVTAGVWCGNEKIKTAVGSGASRTKDDPIPIEVTPEQLRAAQDFHFTFGDGSGWHGYNVVKIDPSGVCQYTFMDQSAGRTLQWRQASFPLNAKTLNDLKQLLIDNNFFRLKKSYSANVADGSQRFIKVEAAGKKKGVYCNNYFPAAVERIRQFCESQIIATHGTAIGQAPSIKLDPKDWEPEQF